ncbi:MAG: helix-turn-helix transcriptional regulator [bacterium]
MESPVDLNDRIKYIREFYAETLEVFSKKLNTNISVISRIENKKVSKIDVDLMIKICNTYHINPIWLLLGQGDFIHVFDFVKQPHIEERFTKVLKLLNEINNEINKINHQLNLTIYFDENK